MWCGSVGQGGGRSQTEAVSELLSVVASRAAGDDANSRAAKPHMWQVAEGAKPLQILSYCHRHGPLRQCGRVNAKPAARWAGAMEAAQFTCADALRGFVALWLCGSVALWLCGSVALRLCGSVALWLCGKSGDLRDRVSMADLSLRVIPVPNKTR